MSLSKYHESLKTLPPSGGGGCHTAILGIANHGIYAGVDPHQIYNDLRQHVHGSRRVPDREIWAAIKRAMADKGQIIHYDFQNRRPVEQRPSFNGEQILEAIIALGAGHGEADIWQASPIRLDWPPEEDHINFIKNSYPPESLIFIGDRYSPGKPGTTIRSALEWVEHFQAGGKTSPHFIPNPLSGQTSTTQDGKPSLRADACVKSFRFAVVEFDNLSREEQLAFWWAARLPVAALIDSGNKSIHGIIALNDVNDADTWTREVENNLFRKMLMPLGVDGACRNEARLSRFPGHVRDNGNRQRLLYLAPGGRRVGND